MKRVFPFPGSPQTHCTKSTFWSCLRARNRRLFTLSVLMMARDVPPVKINALTTRMYQITKDTEGTMMVLPEAKFSVFNQRNPSSPVRDVKI